MDHTLPKLEGSLLIKQAESAIFVIKGTSVALCLFLVIIFIITIIFLDAFIKNRTQSLHLNYIRFQYGDTIETTVRTYANFMKFHSERLQRSGIGIGAEMTNIFLIGTGETAEAYLRHDRGSRTTIFCRVSFHKPNHSCLGPSRMLYALSKTYVVHPKRNCPGPYLSCFSYQHEILHWSVTNIRHSGCHQAIETIVTQLWGLDSDSEGCTDSQAIQRFY